jgi:ADP-heptose:LPS heptosyltransferase
MKITIVFRLSSLGDLAILIPVLYPIATENPADRFILITKKHIAGIFINKPANLTIIPVDTTGKHKNLAGIINLAAGIINQIKTITRQNNTTLRRTKIQVADLHCMLRSTIIDLTTKTLLLLHLKVTDATIIINKGRPEKIKLCTPIDRQLVQLKTTHQRYADVFAALGYTPQKPFTSLLPPRKPDKIIRIGIAPLAKHSGKIWPLNNTDELINKLTRNPNIQIIIFGSTNEAELEFANKLVNKYPNVISATGLGNFRQEFEIMNTLRVMITMDSANMHLASLVAVPVVSIWGATHPFAGFYGYRQDPNLAVQVDLPCRPCSIYGSLKCYTGKHECMTEITVSDVIRKIQKALYSPHKQCSIQ